MVPGAGVTLKALSFSCLVSGLRGFTQLVVGTAGAPRGSFSLSMDSPRGGLRVTGLLTWQLKAPQGTTPRETSRNYVAFSNLASEVTHIEYIEYNILFIKTVTEAPPGTRNEDTDSAF